MKEAEKGSGAASPLIRAFRRIGGAALLAEEARDRMKDGMPDEDIDEALNLSLMKDREAREFLETLPQGTIDQTMAQVLLELVGREIESLKQTRSKAQAVREEPVTAFSSGS